MSDSMTAHQHAGSGATPKPDALGGPAAQIEAESAKSGFEGQRIYMIGIGGCGMSGLARMLRAGGATVVGSDREPGGVIDALVGEGIDVSLDQETASIPESIDLTVVSAAIRPDHPQLISAQDRGIPVLSYAEALGLCMEGTTGIGIAGTHGKSTIAAMLGHVLIEAGLDPTVIVGATCAQLASPGASTAPTGFRLGAERVPRGPYQGGAGILVAEACEFNRSFQNLRPTMAAISAVEADHLDVYGTLDAVVQAFHEFARLVPPREAGGYLLINHDGAHRREISSGLPCIVETVGFAPGADWRVAYDTSSRLVVLSQGPERVAEWTIQLPGAHMAIDSAMAAVLAMRLGATPRQVSDALAGFRGLDRRMQLIGEKHLDAGGGAARAVRVYDDYGHHPTEIDATLRALREFERPEDQNGRLICVFQPHQHSRTRFLLEEFAQSFSRADIVIVPHIYFVRDSLEEKTRVSSADLVDRLRERGVHAMHVYPFEAIVEQLNVICRPGDLLVVMGAGPVWKVAHGYLRSDRPRIGVRPTSPAKTPSS